MSKQKGVINKMDDKHQNPTKEEKYGTDDEDMEQTNLDIPKEQSEDEEQEQTLDEGQGNVGEMR